MFPDPMADGRLGIGGTDPPNAVPLAKSEPKPPVLRRDGEAIVAYPSRMLPLDKRELRRGACECKVFMSGMDFLTRREPGATWEAEAVR